MTDWLSRAACKGLDTNLWYPTAGDSRPHLSALRICKSCPVRTECLEDALSVPADHDFGIRGGLFVRDRERLRRQRSRQKPTARLDPSDVRRISPEGQRRLDEMVQRYGRAV